MGGRAAEVPKISCILSMPDKVYAFVFKPAGKIQILSNNLVMADGSMGGESD